MVELGTPPHNPIFEETWPKVEVVQDAPEIKSPLPKHIQAQINNALTESQEQREELLKIEAVFQALEAKYWKNFDRSKFSIKVAPLLREEIDYLWYELFILINNKWVEIAYINEDWETVIDLTKIKIDDFKHLLAKKASWNYFIRSKDWKLSFYIKKLWKSFPVESRYFTNGIMKYKNIQPKKD